MDLHLYFQKVIWLGGDSFWAAKNSEKAKPPGMCPSFSGNLGELNSINAVLSPPRYLYVQLTRWTDLNSEEHPPFLPPVNST